MDIQTGNQSANRIPTRLTGELRNPIVGLSQLFGAGLIPELHQVSVFDCVIVKITKHGNGSETNGLKEQLSLEVGLSDLQHDPVATLQRKLAQELVHHRLPNPCATVIGVHGEIQDVQTVLVQFIDHESDNFVIFLGDHSNAIALTKTTDEIFFGPGKFKAGVLDAEYRRHITADHPANMNTQRSWVGFHFGLLSSETPLIGITTIPSRQRASFGERGGD